MRGWNKRIYNLTLLIFVCNFLFLNLCLLSNNSFLFSFSKLSQYIFFNIHKKKDNNILKNHANLLNI